MGSSMPLVIVVAILAVTSVTALIASFVRERRTFAGYDELRNDIMALKARLKAEVFRDGDDLVISGTEQKLPVVVRYSYAENTPGLNIRVHSPSTMNLAVVPRNAQAYLPENLRVTVPTGDDMFNSRFIVKADEGAGARMFLMSGSTMRELPKALCSSRTTLNITHGALELSETTIPQPYTGSHTAGHIESLLKMSGVLAQMPGAQLAVVEKPELPKRLLSRTAIVFGAAAALLSIIGAANQLREQPETPKPVNQLAVEERSAGVIAVDAKVIRDLDNFRAVKPEEFDPSFVSWLTARGAEANGRVPLTLNKSAGTSSEEPPDVGYLLTDPKGNRRVVLVYGGKVVFDVRNFTGVAITRVPMGDIPSQKYPAEGDALLVVDPAAPERSFLLYVNGGLIQNQSAPQWADLDLR